MADPRAPALIVQLRQRGYSKQEILDALRTKGLLSQEEYDERVPKAAPPPPVPPHVPVPPAPVPSPVLAPPAGSAPGAPVPAPSPVLAPVAPAEEPMGPPIPEPEGFPREAAPADLEVSLTGLPGPVKSLLRGFAQEPQGVLKAKMARDVIDWAQRTGSIDLENWNTKTPEKQQEMLSKVDQMGLRDIDPATYGPPVGRSLAMALPAAVGMAVGVVKGASDIIPRRGGKSLAREAVFSGFHATEDDLEARVKRFYGAGAAEFSEALRTDLSDNWMAVVELIRHTLGGEAATPAEWEGSPLLQVVREFERATEYGQELVGGTLGGLGALGKHLGDTLRTRPFTSAMILASLGPGKLKGLPKALREKLAIVGRINPTLGTLYDRVAKAGRWAKKQAGRTGAGRTGRQGWEWFRRFTTDQYFHRNKTYSALVEDIMTSPEDFAHKVEHAMERVAREVEAGDLPPGEVRPESPIVDLFRRYRREEISWDELKAQVDLPVRVQLEEFEGWSEIPELRQRDLFEDQRLIAALRTERLADVGPSVQAARAAKPPGLEGLKYLMREMRDTNRPADYSYFMQQAANEDVLPLLLELGQAARRVDDPVQGTLFPLQPEAQAQRLAAIDEMSREVLALSHEIQDYPNDLALLKDPVLVWLQEMPLQRGKSGLLEYHAGYTRVLDDLAEVSKNEAVKGQARQLLAEYVYGTKWKDVREFQDAQVLAASQAAHTTARFSRDAMQSRRFVEMTADVVDELASTFEITDLVRSDTPERFMRLSRVRLEELRKVGQRLQPEKLYNVLSSALAPDSVQALRSPGLRHKVAHAIKKKHPKLGSAAVKGIQKRLKLMAEASLLDQPFDYSIVIPTKEGSARVSLLSETIDVLSSLPGKESRIFRARATRELGAYLARRVYEKRLTIRLWKEVTRFAGRMDDLPTFARALVDDVLAQGKPRPLLLSRFDPKEVGRYMRSAEKGLANALPDYIEKHLETLEDSASAESTHLRTIVRRPEVLQEMVRDLADDMTFEYTTPDEVLYDSLPDIDSLFLKGNDEAKIARARGEKEPRAMTAVDRGLNNSLGTHLGSLRAMDTSVGGAVEQFVKTLFGRVKLGLTVLSMGAQIVNFSSNLLLLSMAMGRTPFDILAEGVSKGRTWLKFRHNQLPPGNLDGAYLAGLERNRLFDTTLVEAELQLLERGGFVSKEWLEGTPRGRALKKVLSAPMVVYRFVDNFFKLFLGLRAMRSYGNLLDKMEVGTFIEVQVAKHKKAYVVREADGFRVFDKEPATKPLPGGTPARVLPGDDVLDVLAKDSVRKANTFMFDYGDVPNLIKWTRRPALAGGLLSPFTTWQYKALDLPGKPGLVSAVLGGEAMVTPRTNSPSVQLLNALSRTRALALRGAAGALMRTALLGEPEQKLDYLFQFSTRDDAAALVTTLSDPRYVSYLPTGSLFFGEPTSRLLRVGQAAYQWALGNKDALLKVTKEELAKMTLAERKAHEKRVFIYGRYAAGEVAGLDDAFELVLLGGSPITELVLEVGEKARRNEPLPWHRVLELAGTLLGGKTATRTATALAAQAYPESQWLRYGYESKYTSPRDLATLTEFFFRELLGHGWRHTKTDEARDRYIGKVKRALDTALATTLKDKNKALEVQKEAARDRGDMRTFTALTEKQETLENLGKQMEQVYTAVENRIKADVTAVGGQVMRAYLRQEERARERTQERTQARQPESAITPERLERLKPGL